MTFEVYGAYGGAEGFVDLFVVCLPVSVYVGRVISAKQRLRTPRLSVCIIYTKNKSNVNIHNVIVFIAPTAVAIGDALGFFSKKRLRAHCPCRVVLAVRIAQVHTTC